MPLLQETIIPQEQVADPHAPECPTCNQRMWLSRIETKLSATEVTSKREYDCTKCRVARVVVVREPL